MNTDIKNLNLDIVFEEDTTEDFEESKMEQFPDMQLPMNKIEEEHSDQSETGPSPEMLSPAKPEYPVASTGEQPQVIQKKLPKVPSGIPMTD